MKNYKINKILIINYKKIQNQKLIKKLKYQNMKKKFQLKKNYKIFQTFIEK